MRLLHVVSFCLIRVVRGGFHFTGQESWRKMPCRFRMLLTPCRLPRVRRGDRDDQLGFKLASIFWYLKVAESSNQALNALECVVLARSNWTLQAAARRVDHGLLMTSKPITHPQQWPKYILFGSFCCQVAQIYKGVRIWYGNMLGTVVREILEVARDCKINLMPAGLALTSWSLSDLTWFPGKNVRSMVSFRRFPGSLCSWHFCAHAMMPWETNAVQNAQNAACGRLRPRARPPRVDRVHSVTCELYKRYLKNSQKVSKDMKRIEKVFKY